MQIRDEEAFDDEDQVLPVPLRKNESDDEAGYKPPTTGDADADPEEPKEVEEKAKDEESAEDDIF